MATQKTSASVLARGLGMGMAFLQALTEEIIAAGGHEEMVHFLTKESARPICKKIAELVVGCDWRAPRSLMERLAREESEGKIPDEIESDTRYDWLSALHRVPIITSVLSFADEAHILEMGLKKAQLLTDEILSQIIGKPAAYPMIVSWQEEPHVVVRIYSEGPGEVLEGQTVQGPVRALHLVPARCFNLEQ